jgi:predicted RNA-binding protein (virulence factor B family)
LVLPTKLQNLKEVKNIVTIDIFAPMNDVEVGTICKLKVAVMNGRIPLLDFNGGIIPLPAIDAPLGTAVDSEIEVFLYYDEDGDIMATTQLPELALDGFASVVIVSTSTAGAYADIGTKRDLMIPTREQVSDLKHGSHCVITLKNDVARKRLYGSTKIRDFCDNSDIQLERGQEVQAMIYDRFKDGRRALVNKQYYGVIMWNDIVQTIRVGNTLRAFVKKIEGDTLFISPQREGKLLLEDAKVLIMDYLNANGGYVRLTDDSDPDEIKLRLKMSKKTYKKAVGMLYKTGDILITTRGIKLNKTGEIPEDADKYVADPEPEDDRTIYRPNPRPGGRGRAPQLPSQKLDNSRSERPERSDRPDRSDSSDRSNTSDSGGGNSLKDRITRK